MKKLNSQSVFAKQWQEAMEVWLKSLVENERWDVIDKPEIYDIDNNLVYRIK